MRDLKSPAVAANRFGLGARPGDLEHIGGDARSWLTAQLQGPAASPAAPLGGVTLAASASILAQLLTLRQEVQAARKATRNTVVAPQDPAGSAGQKASNPLAEAQRPVYFAEVQARFQESLTTERPFVERLIHFWGNHFAVSADKALMPGLAGSLEREAIRPHVLGSFHDMLLAVESHPAMLLYLDNTGSTGPNSQAALRRARNASQPQAGINENLAREILELHTLGANAPYTQADVTTFAEVLSGWSVGRPGKNEPAGVFLFRPQLHEPGDKTVLGKHYGEGRDGGLGQGLAVLSDCAQHPATARHIATKLARHFVADDPPTGLVHRLAEAFHASGGDLPTLYRALIEAPEAWTAGLTKLKTPADYLISCYRGLGLPPLTGKAAAGSFEQLGQRLFTPGSPAGWPDRSADWDGASALLKRIEWAHTTAQHLNTEVDARALAPQLLGANLTPATAKALARAASPAQGLTLLLASPEFLHR